MYTEYAKNIKLNADGNVDVGYHIDVGHQLRAAYMSQAIAQIKTWLASHLTLQGMKFSVQNWAHHH